MARLAVLIRHRQNACGGHANTGLRGQGHGGVFHQRRIHSIAQLTELDDARPCIGLQQSLGPCASQRDAGLDQALHLSGHRGLGLQVFHRGIELRQVPQLGVWAQRTRHIAVCGYGDAQRAKPIITCKQQHLQNGQPRRSVHMANDALTPAVRPGIVDGTRGTAALASGELLP